MNLSRRVEKLEQRAGARRGVKFVVRIPPKMSAEEWPEYARNFERRGGFTVNLKREADDEPTEES